MLMNEGRLGIFMNLLSLTGMKQIVNGRILAVLMFSIFGGIMAPQNLHAESEKAYLAGGCFWCMEAIFQREPGVIKVVSGYSGGKTKNPTYEEVCGGRTGFAESIEVEFDPAKVSYEKILTLFWKAHDPTTLNRQGNDVGTQYRSAIFYTNDTQKAVAEKSRAETQKTTHDKVVTEITPFSGFYSAEGYHQNYYNQHTTQPYCMAVIAPKLRKLESTNP